MPKGKLLHTYDYYYIHVRLLKWLICHVHDLIVLLIHLVSKYNINSSWYEFKLNMFQ